MTSLETDRLIIRNFRSDDWQQLQELAVAYQASEAAQYEEPWPTSTEEVKGMAGWFAGGDDYLAVCLKDTGQLIGLLAINRRDDAEGQVHNLGYVFHPGYYGQGYATEACRAAMAYLFDELAVDGILTGTHPDNGPSVRLLERLGLKQVARGEYAISRGEWSALGVESRGQEERR
jgi:ribosomal-protein-alanine N-acetyltransferase